MSLRATDFQSARQLGTSLVAAPGALKQIAVLALVVSVDTQMSVVFDAGYVNEVQSVYTDATGGTLTFTYSGQTTGNVAFDATAGTLETALEALSTITDVTVTGAGTLADPWIVTFVDPGGADLALMTLDPASLTGVTSTIATDTAGATAANEVQSIYNQATGGTFTLSFDGQGPTGDLQYDAPDAPVAAQGTLTMDTQPTAPIAAQGTLTLAVEPSDGDTLTLDSKVYTFETALTDVDGNIAIGGSLASAQANLEAAIDLSGTAGTDYATSMTAHTTVTMGNFAANDAIITAVTIGTAGNSIATTETFFSGSNVFDAATLGTTTAGVEPDTYTVDAKVYTFETTLTNVDGNVAIGGSLAQAKLNLVAAMDLSGVAGTDYATAMTAHATVDIAAFVGDDAVLTAKTAGTAGNALATTETFAAGTNVFDAITLGTTTPGENGIETELEALSNITAITISGVGTSVDPWIVTFTDPGTTDVAMITADDTNLTGGTPASTIAEDTKGVTLITEIQSVYTNAGSGTFTLTYSGQTSGNIEYDATAAAVETALEALSNITDVTVTGSGTSSDPWLVSFIDPAGAVAEMTATDTNLVETNVISESTAGAGTKIWEVFLGVDGHEELAQGDDPWFVCNANKALTYTMSASGNIAVALVYEEIDT